MGIYRGVAARLLVDNATKNKLTNGTDQADLTSGNACWETPPRVFQKLNEDFGPFDIDLTADRQRHLCPLWFGPESPCGQFDTLQAVWHLFGRTGYSNPPYGPFVQRLLIEAKDRSRRGDFASTLLLPLRVTKAFKAHILNGAAELLFCDARITFFENGAPRLNEKKWREDAKAVGDPAVFDSIIVRYLPGEFARPRIDVWQVPKHVTADDLARAVVRRSEAARCGSAVDPSAASTGTPSTRD